MCSSLSSFISVRRSIWRASSSRAGCPSARSWTSCARSWGRGAAARGPCRARRRRQMAAHRAPRSRAGTGTGTGTTAGTGTTGTGSASTGATPAAAVTETGGHNSSNIEPVLAVTTSLMYWCAGCCAACRRHSACCCMARTRMVVMQLCQLQGLHSGSHRTVVHSAYPLRRYHERERGRGGYDERARSPRHVTRDCTYRRYDHPNTAQKASTAQQAPRKHMHECGACCSLICCCRVACRRRSPVRDRDRDGYRHGDSSGYHRRERDY